MKFTVRLFSILLLLFSGLLTQGKEPPKADDSLFISMKSELKRAQANLGKLTPAAYFISYGVNDQSEVVVSASMGALVNSTGASNRIASVIVRVGGPALDNSHEENRKTAISAGTLPMTDDTDAITRALWHLTYNQYRRSAKAYLAVKTKTEVNAKEEDTSPDFSVEKPETHVDQDRKPKVADTSAMEALARKLSARFRNYPEVYNSAVVLTSNGAREYFVSTDGSEIITDSASTRLVIQAETRAEDGMELVRVETFQADSPDGLPKEDALAAKIDRMAEDLKALRKAPLAEPFNGPALLSGRSSAVFFHEVLGHRLEGQRQKGQNEGQTFTKKLNQQVLPSFLSIVDDPTLRSLDGQDLSGYYQFDDEGVPAKKVELIEDGVLKNFLLGRTPIANFANSNGHGRSQQGMMPAGRQGNLIISSSKTVKDSDLRAKLIEEIKKQGKPYGLYFEDIEGGFTLTQRRMPQAFQVLPVMVWRVYADGRPDELVRGVDIVGTPMAALNRIMLTGDKQAVFNGMCGAESGYVPVSAAAPAMLFSEIEVQKRGHSLARPPILPPPSVELKGGRQ